MEERWILVPSNDNCVYLVYQHCGNGVHAFNLMDKGDTLDADDYPVMFKTEAEANEFMQSEHFNPLRDWNEEVHFKPQAMLIDPAHEKDGGQPWKQD